MLLTQFALTIIIVGFVTAGLRIRFDRFFAILLLLFLFGFGIKTSINVFLWVIALGALTIILQNKTKIYQLPKQKKIKLFLISPIFALFASLIGSVLFEYTTSNVLIITLGILAILYGARLVFIHFQKHELEYVKANPLISKICGLAGPWISGFFIGFVGTSFKSLKIPFAIKIGKMNAGQVYLGNTITAFFASLFAIIWHYILNQTNAVFYENMLLGLATFAGIHFVYELTEIVFPDKWRKSFQILIGIILIFVSAKIFMLIN
ncbi:MAG TPA: hypothetical protein ENJ75_03270 [Candidatus Kaiserbacteria bacterium]|nr:hypothetical protein [Candidatus Kaiserbacteria bacterium]